MNIELYKTYRLSNGERVWIDGSTSTQQNIRYFRGTTQRGEIMSFSPTGDHQTINTRAKRNIVSDALVAPFKVFKAGSLWVTRGQRVWEVIAICRDEKFPIVANELLTDDSFHVNIKRFDWDGKSHDGSATELVGPA